MAEQNGYFTKALNHYQQCYKIRQEVLEPNHEEISGILNNISLVYECLNQWELCKSYCQQSMDICRRSKDTVQNRTKLRKREITLARHFIFLGDILSAEILLQGVLRYFKQEAPNWHMEAM